MTIRFYRTGERPYGCFSNFSRHPFVLDGREWPTSEHYFQAQKFLDPAHQEEVRAAATPKAAAAMGRDRARPLRADWQEVRDDVMRRAVLAKFSAHPALRDLLVGTGDEEIVEDSPTDDYWGCGADGRGKNRLGAILMEVRTALRARGGP